MPIILILLILTTMMPFSAYAADEGDLTFNPPGAEQVYFNHKFHVQARGFKCTACHFQLVTKDGGHYKMKKEKVNKRDFCFLCHNGMKSFDVSNEKNCQRCHKKQ